MNKLKWIFFLIFSNISILTASGQGCAIGYATANEVIYYGPLAGTRNFGLPIAYNNSPGTAYPTACPKYNYNAATGNMSCTVNGSTTGVFKSAANFRMVPCPLDDYIAWLLLPIGIFSFFYLRKKQLLMVKV
ncbi:hypothetical protein [Pedobacter aquatilis]|uniref:hypothetical protein n=1 Tax=Pedobacter aquatilis TaxID=351343 RepID=UPI002931D464|nr:hypothetical protein [Pedobacter aquatilis]